MYDLLKHGVDVEQFVITKERKFPTEAHWDHHSEEYVHSEKDENSAHLEVDKYN